MVLNKKETNKLFSFQLFSFSDAKLNTSLIRNIHYNVNIKKKEILKEKTPKWKNIQDSQEKKRKKNAETSKTRVCDIRRQVEISISALS